MTEILIYGVVMFTAGSVCERLFGPKIRAAGVRAADWVARKFGWIE
jgi:hypothetical protein